MNGVNDAREDIDRLDVEIKKVNLGLANAPSVEQTDNGAIRESYRDTGRRSIMTATEDE